MICLWKSQDVFGGQLPFAQQRSAAGVQLTISKTLLSPQTGMGY